MKAEENICHHTVANLRRSRVESRSHLAARVTPSYEDRMLFLFWYYSAYLQLPTLAPLQKANINFSVVEIARIIS